MACGAIAFAAARADARLVLREPLTVVLLLLALLGALSALWTLGPEARTLRWAAVTAGYAGVLVGSAVAARTRGGRIVLAAGIAAIAALGGVLGIAAVIAQEEPYALRIAGDWRAAGPFEYPPALALLMVSALPVLMAGVRTSGTALRLAAGLGIAISAAVIALAHSRIALALGVAIVAVAAYRMGRGRAALGVGLAVALAAGSLAFGSGDGPESGFLHGRDDTWGAAVETFLDRPVHGAGADAFLAGSARHQDGAAIVFAHNLPLEFAAELGIPGLLLALGLYLATATLLWRRRAVPVAWLFGAAVLAFPLANLLDWPWHLAGSGAIWAIGCGVLAGPSGLGTNVQGTAS